MPRARLVGHCEQLTIRPIDRPGTHFDDLADEPLAGFARDDAIKCLAQVDDTRRNERTPSQGGARLPVTLEATFLTRQVKAKGWKPMDGDLVTERANKKGGDPVAVNLYLTRVRYDGATHYGNELIIADLVARDPRQSNEGLG